MPVPATVKFAAVPAIQPIGVDVIPISLAGGDVDLTAANGPTGGYAARAILVGGTADNIKVDTAGGGSGRVVAMAANQQLNVAVTKVYQTPGGTPAAPVYAIL